MSLFIKSVKKSKRKKVLTQVQKINMNKLSLLVFLSKQYYCFSLKDSALNRTDESKVDFLSVSH